MLLLVVSYDLCILLVVVKVEVFSLCIEDVVFFFEDIVELLVIIEEFID